MEVNPELEQLLADSEKGVQYGPQLMKIVSDRFLNTISRPLSKETSTKLKEGLLIPENCKLFRPPKMNQEIWKALPAAAKIKDLQQQQIQSVMSFGLVGLSSIANIVAANYDKMPKEFANIIIKIAQDTADLVGEGVQSINQKRRSEVGKFMRPEAAGICSAEVKPHELLFGGDLSESLKLTRATANVMRQPQFPTQRYSPYRNSGPRRGNTTPNPGNYNRFQSTPRRGGFQIQRGRPNPERFPGPSQFAPKRF